MPYTAKITRANPTCLVFLIDQSGSMSNPFGRQPDIKKADGVADALNRLLYELVIKSTKGEGIYDYFRLAVIGYGQQVGSALPGPLASCQLVSIGDLANNPLRVEVRTRQEKDPRGQPVQRTSKIPIWIEPVAGGNTPLAEALTQATELIQGFLKQYPDCFPPLVINLTDGRATTDPRPQARVLSSQGSSDGPVLMFNVHISEKPDSPIEFPDSEAGLPDNFARLLFRISSVLPPPFLEVARVERVPVTEGSRGFVFNADLLSVIKFLNVGTKVGTQPNRP
jgi:hypothetical protein